MVVFFNGENPQEVEKNPKQRLRHQKRIDAHNKARSRNFTIISYTSRVTTLSHTCPSTRRQLNTFFRIVFHPDMRLSASRNRRYTGRTWSARPAECPAVASVILLGHCSRRIFSIFATNLKIPQRYSGLVIKTSLYKYCIVP